MSGPDHPPVIVLPPQPALCAAARHAVWLTPDGEVETLNNPAAAERLAGGPRPIVCHARATARRLDMAPFPCFDVLELFAFTRPARFALPTPLGLAEVLGLALPTTLEHQCETLILAVQTLLEELARDGDEQARSVAWAMARGGWPWGPAVLAALGMGDKTTGRGITDGLAVWSQLPDWQDRAPPTPPGNDPVAPGAAKERLRALLGSASEDRPEQRDYAAAAADAFQPRDHADAPHLVLAEAGTGVGKTLGYIAPASLWAEQNEGTVWFSTFTRNLQRQLDGELDRLYPLAAEKQDRVVIRKGRENYLCLLNFEDAVRTLPTRGGQDVAALGLMARWAQATRDGDMVGGDFPAWLGDMLGRSSTTDLTDTRGECIYAACSHYKRCFVERTVRRARHADIVVANHALVMVQAALGGDEGAQPTRYVFDEGHHLFEAADSAFAASLSGRETAELRRWLIGGEDRQRSRARGLKARLGDLIAGTEDVAEAVDEVMRSARALPGPAWGQRIAGGTPQGPAESFLALVRQQVYARDRNAKSPYSLETEPAPAVPGLMEAAGALEAALARLDKPLMDVRRGLAGLLDSEADDLDTSTRNRVDALARSIERRAVAQVAAWRAMLRDLSAGTPDDYVDWFGVERIGGRDFDVGYHRHWIDPTRPFAATLLEPAHGALITSATLRDRGGDEEQDWRVAEARTGTHHVVDNVNRVAEPSPFDYPKQTRVFVVGDVGRDDAGQVASAYRELFLAAGGGALGLFTAISRLRAVHGQIAAPLEDAGLALLAQHVDAMDTGTLVDIFRAETDTCLLGTDAVRDGVDVPGRSLRLIVFDRVPWPRPGLLHKARKTAFGGQAYDDMLTRLKLKQAYGRLIRRADDHGVFVMLDRRLPTRLLSAFPDGVEVHRVGLAEAISETRAFLTGGT